MYFLTPESPLKSLKSFLVVFILMIAAIVGNYFSITLIPGVYFIFGSIGVLIAVRLYGPMWGMAVALIGTLYTYFAYQPFSIVLFTLEALFVGLVLKRRNFDLLFVDGIFWLFCGIPLGFLINKVILGIQVQLVALILLKLVVNGVLNSLIASLILTYLPFFKKLKEQKSETLVSYYNTLFGVFVGLVLIPSLMVLLIQSQHEFAELEENLEFNIKHQTIEFESQLAFWQQQHRNPLNELADYASNNKMEPTQELQHYVVSLNKSFPQFVGISVCDKNGRSIAIYPETQPDGKSAIGYDFSDRDYFKKVSSSLKPYVTPVFKGKAAVIQPLVTMTMPIITNGRFNGIVSGALDLSYIDKVLSINTYEKGFHATVVDSNGMVISSTRKDVGKMTDFYRERKGQRRKYNTQIYQWFPGDNHRKHKATQWGNSFYVSEKKVEGVPWTLIVEVPVAPSQNKLMTVSIKGLTLMLVLVIMSVWFSAVFSRRMTRPLSQLASFATNLPERLNLEKTEICISQNNILEVRSLKNSFLSMTDILQQNFKELQNQYHFSNALNRVAGAIASGDDTKTILEKANSIVGEALDVDVSKIFEINLRRGQIQILSEWYHQRNTKRRPWEKLDLNKFTKSNEYLLKYQTWLESHHDKVACSMEEDGIATFMHDEVGIKSLIWYPFLFHDEGYYILAFNQIIERRDWNGEELQFVSAVAKQVEIAMQKLNYLNTIWEEKERAQVTLHSIGDAVITTDAEGRVVYLNPVAEGLTGWESHEAIGLPLMEVFKIVNEDTGLPAENPVDKCLSKGNIVGLANHTVLIHRHGQRFAIEDSAAPIRSKDGRIVGVILVFHDVSEKRQMVNQLTQLAYYDPLTQLPNRILFLDRLNVALAKAQRNGEVLAVMFLDLDRFKLVNDMMGHVMGDSLLKDVAVRLSKCIRQSDTIARLGGDEFTVIVPRINDPKDAAKIAKKILDAIQMPFSVNGHQFHVSASIGIAVFPQDGQDAESLMKHADMAMYQAKEQDLNSYRFFTAELNNKIVERLALEHSLRKSLDKMDFILYYQPQVNIATGRIEGVEALIRWNHPEHGIILPEEFIHLAEDSGLIVPISEWVLRTACSQIKTWHDAGFPSIKVSVNICPYQFRRKDLTNLVSQVLEETGLRPDLLEVEITESVTMNDADYTVQVLGDLRNMGVRIALDDFGTGYSSLNYLKCFPINTLKIDQSFIKDVLINSEDAAIVTTIIAMAKNLNLNVIAEGVETSEQLRFLLEKECEKMQGYYFSKPVPPAELEILLQKNWLT